MTETVPADIALAICDVVAIAVGHARAHPSDQPAMSRAFTRASDKLDALIIHHLRGHAEMKTALERIEQGV